MSLIQSIKTRRFDDLINEGVRTTLTGTFSGTGSEVTLQELQTPASEGEEGQSFILTGYQFSSDAGSPVLVTLGFNDGSTTTDVFNGYVGGGQTIDHTYSLGDWIFSDLGDNIVAQAPSGTIAYTIEGRFIRGIKPLGYIERIGTPNHSNPVFPPDSGLARGQSEF